MLKTHLSVASSSTTATLILEDKKQIARPVAEASSQLRHISTELKKEIINVKNSEVKKNIENKEVNNKYVEPPSQLLEKSFIARLFLGAETQLEYFFERISISIELDQFCDYARITRAKNDCTIDFAHARAYFIDAVNNKEIKSLAKAYEILKKAHENIQFDLTTYCLYAIVSTKYFAITKHQVEDVIWMENISQLWMLALLPEAETAEKIFFINSLLTYGKLLVNENRYREAAPIFLTVLKYWPDNVSALLLYCQAITANENLNVFQNKVVANRTVYKQIAGLTQCAIFCANHEISDININRIRKEYTRIRGLYTKSPVHYMSLEQIDYYLFMMSWDSDEVAICAEAVTKILYDLITKAKKREKPFYNREELNWMEGINKLTKKYPEFSERMINALNNCFKQWQKAWHDLQISGAPASEYHLALLIWQAVCRLNINECRNSWIFLFQAGFIYFKLNYYMKAIFAFEEALKLGGNDDPTLNRFYAKALIKCEDNEKAEIIYLKCLEANPTDFQLLLASSKFYYQIQSYNKAMDILIKAKQYYPQEMDFAYGLALCYFACQKYREAATEIAMAIKLQPKILKPNKRLKQWDTKIKTALDTEMKRVPKSQSPGVEALSSPSRQAPHASMLTSSMTYCPSSISPSLQPTSRSSTISPLPPVRGAVPLKKK